MAQAVRHEFAPPPPPGLGRALLMALLAHGFLVLMLTVGLQWKRTAPQTASFEAELWAAVPTQAAPQAVNDNPEDKPPVEEASPPPMPPLPVTQAPPPNTQTPDIALAKEKERKLQEDRERQEREQQKLEKKQLEKAKQDKERSAKAALEEEKPIPDAPPKSVVPTSKVPQATKAEVARRDKEEARRLEEIRQQNLKRMAGLAASGGGTGDTKSTGTAAQSAGPSAGYAGRVRAKIKPNIVFTEALNTNPTTEVEVRTSPDGTILSSRIVQSSGVKAWDEAVLKALEKTEVLPKDTDGRVPSTMTISFRPRDN